MFFSKTHKRIYVVSSPKKEDVEHIQKVIDGFREKGKKFQILICIKEEIITEFSEIYKPVIRQKEVQIEIES